MFLSENTCSIFATHLDRMIVEIFKKLENSQKPTPKARFLRTEQNKNAHQERRKRREKTQHNYLSKVRNKNMLWKKIRRRNEIVSIRYSFNNPYLKRNKYTNNINISQLHATHKNSTTATCSRPHRYCNSQYKKRNEAKHRKITQKNCSHTHRPNNICFKAL